MRLWTIHPRYLDAKGLVAAWREALLAQKVLAGRTRGYRHHPQLIRFQERTDPIVSISAFLTCLAAEADERGYHFDKGKILRRPTRGRIEETHGQLLFEWRHLRRKLKVRAPADLRKWRAVDVPEAHPLFRIIPGKVRPWEKGITKPR
jgi:hypothetical protein